MPAFSEFTFPSSTGKNTIHVLRCDPSGEPRGIVQIAHGVAEHIGRYEDFMKFLAENGFVAVGNDHLGHGRSVTDPADRGFFCEEDGWNKVTDDMNILHDIMREEFPGLPYIFFGHSMGSFLTRTYMIRYPDAPDLAILCGTGHQAKPTVVSGLAAAELSAKAVGARKPGKALNELAFGSYNKRTDNRTPVDWISSIPEEVDKYVADPECGFIACVGLFRDMMTGISFITDPANIALMNKDLPVLFVSGWEDPVGEYGKGVKRAFGAFCEAGMKNVHIKLYPTARHELLHDVCREETMKDILEWIEKNI